MSRITALLCLVATIIFFAGCEGHCITVDGTYKDWSGGFTWCLDSNQSASAGRTVLTNETQQSATLINEKEAIAITEKLAQVSSSMKIKSGSNFEEFNKFLKEIMEQTDGTGK